MACIAQSTLPQVSGRRRWSAGVWASATSLILLVSGVRTLIGQSDAACSIKMAAANALNDTVRAILSRQDRASLERGVWAAQEAARFSRDCGSFDNVAALYGNMGSLYTEMSQYDSARVFLRREAALLDTLIGRRDSAIDSTRLYALLGAATYSLAVSYRRTGQLDSALVYAQRALPLRRLGADTVGQGRTLNAIGEVLHTLGRREGALRAYRSALSVRLATHDSVGMSTTYRNLATLLIEQGLPDLAHGDLDAASLVDERRADTNALMLDALGHAHLSMAQERWEEAYRYLRFAYGNAERLGDHFVAGWAREAAGKVLAKLDRGEAAFRQWIMAFDHLQQIGDQVGLAEVTGDLAHWYHRTRLPPSLDTAVAIYQRTAELMRSLERVAGADPLRLSLTEEQRGSLFSDWILAELAIPSQDSVLRALAVADAGRAQALVDLLHCSGRPQTEVHLFEKQDLPPAINETESLLYYAVTNDTLLIWVKAAGELRLVRSPVSEDSLARLVSEVRRGLGVGMPNSRQGLPRLETTGRGVEVVGGNQASLNEAWNQLSELLVPKVFLERLPEGQEVVLLPQGVLNLVPFAALPVGQANEPLGVRYALRYVLSLESLSCVQKRVAGRGESLVVGSIVMPYVQTLSGDSEPLPMLLGAQEEAMSVGRALHVTPLPASEATEPEVLNRLSAAEIVHLATHGYAYASEDRARDSWIALSRGGGADGLLTVGELMDDSGLSLSAELVVLSACQTGLGDLKNAEGTVGFQRAFLAKGAKSVLVSLWKVDDTATRLLMEAFYRHWRGDNSRGGVTKAEALRLAQLDVRNSGYGDPVYWAAFQLVGAR